MTLLSNKTLSRNQFRPVRILMYVQRVCVCVFRESNCVFSLCGKGLGYFYVSHYGWMRFVHLKMSGIIGRLEK